MIHTCYTPSSHGSGRDARGGIGAEGDEQQHIHVWMSDEEKHQNSKIHTIFSASYGQAREAERAISLYVYVHSVCVHAYGYILRTQPWPL